GTRSTRRVPVHTDYFDRCTCRALVFSRRENLARGATDGWDLAAAVCAGGQQPCVVGRAGNPANAAAAVPAGGEAQALLDRSRLWSGRGAGAGCRRLPDVSRTGCQQRGRWRVLRPIPDLVDRLLGA